MRVCTKGVWDESIPGISFDENGVSNYCKLQETMMANYPRGEKGLADWNALVLAMKKAGKNSRYDCVVGVSGGVDSSYLLHIAGQYGLRPLAVNLDNGFNSQIAVQNIYKVTTTLGIDLETYVINYEEVQDLLRAYMKAGMPWIDTPTDLAIKATMYKVAQAVGIQYILRGNDFRSEGKQPKEWTYADARQLRFIHKRFGSGVRLKTYPMLTLPKMVYAGLIKGIKDIRPYYYLNYKKQDAKQLMIRLYDWQDYGGHHHENLFTKFSMAYWLPRKFGIDKRKINLSAQVLSQAITRDEALAQLQQPFASERELAETRSYVQKKLALSDNDFQQIWSATGKNTFDYPSNYELLVKLASRLRPLISRLYAFTPMTVTANQVLNAKK
ncbi:N-acetyl sugar amidotransferase [Spirosoma endbachense]|uniref:N-acetyl sugar amidotransferase n=1 Tax=Spirosoma endbachense TaxID=2666025 RepID=A0A6P1VU36_9BACT|nr:N-acetyl sugar amidotransferase [Spirosoma endbachense]QHV95257.1 N-acetyl sugar amidotransferase [Spirosoma endbachense]